MGLFRHTRRQGSRIDVRPPVRQAASPAAFTLRIAFAVSQTKASGLPSVAIICPTITPPPADIAEATDSCDSGDNVNSTLSPGAVHRKVRIPIQPNSGGLFTTERETLVKIYILADRLQRSTGLKPNGRLQGRLSEWIRPFQNPYEPELASCLHTQKF